MSKNGRFLTLIIIAALLLSGCAQVPQLTEEQNDMVTEYAAALLLKYDSENHTRLVDYEDYRARYENAKAIYDASKQKYEEEIVKAEEERRKEAENALNNLDQYANDTRPSGESDSTNEGRGDGGRKDGTGGATVIDSISLDKYLDLDNFSVDYAGFDVMKDYPEDGSDIGFVASASSGGELLITYFNVTNNNSYDVDVDLLHKVETVSFSINGEAFKNYFMTLLDDDLTLLLDKFAPGETKRLVIVSEVKEGTIVDSIRMNIKVFDKSKITKDLK